MQREEDKKITTEGVHYLVDLWNCNPKLLNYRVFLRLVLRKSSDILGTKVINECFHQFYPQGVTGLLLLAESHISIHTFPEHNFASMDFYLCNLARDTTKAIQWISKQLETEEIVIDEVYRGYLNADKQKATRPM